MTNDRRRRNEAHATASAPRLIEEIAAIEQRLRPLGPDEDWGYERAMIRFYEQQLGLRRRLLC